MSKLHKKISISLFIISMLLVSTFGALAAEFFTLVGELDISGTAPDPIVYKVGDQVFVLDPAAVCTDAAGLPMLCTALVGGALVEVKGNSVGTVYTATSVAVLPEKYEGVVLESTATKLTVADPLTFAKEEFVMDAFTKLPATFAVGDMVEVTYKVVGTSKLALEVKFVESGVGKTYKYTGTIGSIGDTWSVGAFTFLIDSSTTTLPEFYAINDTVEVTFEITTVGYKAIDITLIASDPESRYTYEGILTAFDDTFWTVGDHIFNITELDLPIYFGVGDVVMLEFRMVGAAMDFFATDILNLVTYVPVKTESSRCDNVRDHPGVQKIADDVGADYEEIWNLFCKGFGLGEIKQAYRYAGEWANSDYTPEMLLALRAQGYSWGDLKKMAQGNIPPEGFGDGNGDDSEEIAAPGNNKNKEKDKDKGTPPGLLKKLDNGDAPTAVESPDGPGNSENAPGQLKDKDKDKDKNKNK